VLSWTIQNALFDIPDNERHEFARSECFVAVVRTRNFRRAAPERYVSVSGLSQRLRNLEDGSAFVMNRTTSSVGLTEAGELLSARVGPALPFGVSKQRSSA
jgi:DNA-binding transcriptional LysR family regulator